jgi:uncharacterized protein involved in cysteine biosynthesis
MHYLQSVAFLCSLSGRRRRSIIAQQEGEPDGRQMTYFEPKSDSRSVVASIHHLSSFFTSLVITFFLSAIPQVAKQLALVIFLSTLLLLRVSFFVSARIS